MQNAKHIREMGMGRIIAYLLVGPIALLLIVVFMALNGCAVQPKVVQAKISIPAEEQPLRGVTDVIRPVDIEKRKNLIKMLNIKKGDDVILSDGASYMAISDFSEKTMSVRLWRQGWPAFDFKVNDVEIKKVKIKTHDHKNVFMISYE